MPNSEEYLLENEKVLLFSLAERYLPIEKGYVPTNHIKREKMEKYKNISGKSKVNTYEIDTEEDSITVKFQTDGTYVYNYQSTGASNIEKMKTLALKGKGLDSFISRFVKQRYAKRLDRPVEV